MEGVGTNGNIYKDSLPFLAEKLGADGLINELCNGFRLLADKKRRTITLSSLKKNSALLGLTDLGDDELQSMITEGDMDGDGQLSEMEFCVLMIRLSPGLMKKSWLSL